MEHRNTIESSFVAIIDGQLWCNYENLLDNLTGAKNSVGLGQKENANYDAKKIFLMISECDEHQAMQENLGQKT